MASLTNNEPSYNDARKSRNWSDWEDSCIDKVDGLWRSGCIAEEVPTDSLSTWDNLKIFAYEVINAIWVLKIKRGPNGEINKYKGRCCANDTESSRERRSFGLECFSPAVRRSTFKTQIAAS